MWILCIRLILRQIKYCHHFWPLDFLDMSGIICDLIDQATRCAAVCMLDAAGSLGPLWEAVSGAVCWTAVPFIWAWYRPAEVLGSKLQSSWNDHLFPVLSAIINEVAIKLCYGPLCFCCSNIYILIMECILSFTSVLIFTSLLTMCFYYLVFLLGFWECNTLWPPVLRIYRIFCVFLLKYLHTLNILPCCKSC